MMNDEREGMRDALLSGIEPSEELRDRFQDQLERLVRGKLSRARKLGNVICATVFLAMSGIFGYVTFFVTTAADPGLTPFARSFMCLSFAAGSLGFLAGAAYAVGELRRGLVAPRQRQHAMVGIPTAFLLLYFIAWLVFWRRLDIPAAQGVYISTGLLFFWITAVGQVLLYTSRWHREDILLEQKRTQLEIALLREELLRKEPPE